MGNAEFFTALIDWFKSVDPLVGFMGLGNLGLGFGLIRSLMRNDEMTKYYTEALGKLQDQLAQLNREYANANVEISTLVQTITTSLTELLSKIKERL